MDWKERDRDKDELIQEEKDMVYLIDMDCYELLYVNPAFEMRMRSAYGEKNGREQKCYEIIHEKQEPCDFCDNDKLCGRQLCRREQKDPAVKEDFLITDHMIQIPGRNLRLEIIRPITRLQREKRAIQEQLERENMLVKCIRTLTEQKNTDEAILRLLEHLVQYFEAQRSYLYEVDDEAQTVENTYNYEGEGEEVQNVPQKRITFDEIKIWMQRLKKEEVLHLKDITRRWEEGEQEYQFFARLGIQELIAAPLWDAKKERITGFVGISNPKRRQQYASLLESICFFIQDDLNKRRLSDMLWNLSYMDSLSGVYNRNKYNEELQRLSEIHIKCLGVIFADLNGLKQENDDYGHIHGDLLIRKTAAVLAQYFPEQVYRIGGDEFVILCPNVSCDKLKKQLDLVKSCLAGDEISLSAGYSWRGSGHAVLEQVSYAEKRMYEEKLCFHQEEESGERRRRESMLSELNEAIDRKEFMVYLQPFIRLLDGVPIGAEALVRKKSPSGVLITPSAFLPGYEQANIIYRLDLYVFEEVCKFIARNNRRLTHRLNVSVNFSRNTLLHSNIIDFMIATCQSYGVQTEQIMIEVKENMNSVEIGSVAEASKALRSAGFDVYLDDFGSNYANLPLLTEGLFDVVKIDKSLVDRMADREGQIVLRHTIAMCRELDKVKPLAEGIETERQWRQLMEMGCEIGQGYLFSKPLSMMDFEKCYLVSPERLCR